MKFQRSRSNFKVTSFLASIFWGKFDIARFSRNKAQMVENVPKFNPKKFQPIILIFTMWNWPLNFVTSDLDIFKCSIINIDLFGWNFWGFSLCTFPASWALFRKNRAISNLPQNIEAKKKVALKIDMDLWNLISS